MGRRSVRSLSVCPSCPLSINFFFKRLLLQTTALVLTEFGRKHLYIHVGWLHSRILAQNSEETYGSGVTENASLGNGNSYLFKASAWLALLKPLLLVNYWFECLVIWYRSSWRFKFVQMKSLGSQMAMHLGDNVSHELLNV